MGNRDVYGSPPRCIPLHTAAAAAGMTVAELKTALGTHRVIIVTHNKLAVTPAHLEAVAPGASAGLKAINPTTDAEAENSERWG